MSSASESTIQALEFIVNPLPVGTNLPLLHVLGPLSGGSAESGRRVSRPVMLGVVCSAGTAQQPSGA